MWRGVMGGTLDFLANVTYSMCLKASTSIYFSLTKINGTCFVEQLS